MAALLAALACLSLASAPTAPLEPQATTSLQKAQQSLLSGDRGRGLATLDSLVMSDGVTVALESDNLPGDAVARGLDAWNSALGERPFRLVPAGANADVVVRFVPSINEANGDAQGYVKARREMSWSSATHAYRLRATILVRDNAMGRKLSANEITSVVAHEAGHLLGLADVPSTDRLMGPMILGRPNLGPTGGEIAAISQYRASIRQSYPKTVDKR